MSGFPIQYAKVQPPPLREETLARHRLLDWLATKIHHRVILLLADAGYGKTTLLADFSGRTRLRTMWYRLDDDDRDWISLLNHLVAAGRELDPAFAPTTAAMLADTSLTGPTRDAVIDVFMRELQSIAPHGAILMFDDFHLVDDAPDAQRIARELVARAPERLTIIFASRRPPTIPLARLRAIGEIAELTTDDLRFDADETARLFRESYKRSIDPDVIAEVAARTEGWAASLQLVNAALRDRTPGEIRSFVRGLNGADRDLYDYLAEEVVGDLSSELQDFLMRTSILQVVTPELAQVVTGLEPPAVGGLIASAERATLLGRRARSPRTDLRYHPLVGQFLLARLEREHGGETVRELHRTVAAHAEDRDWRIAAHHYWLAGDRSRTHDIIDRSAQSIIGRGEYLVAVPFVTDLPEADQRASFAVILSRSAFKQGDVELAMELAQRAISIGGHSDIALANVASLSLTIGDAVASEAAALELAAVTTDPIWLGIAEGLVEMVRASVDSDIRQAIRRLHQLATAHQEHAQPHFEGITCLNLAESLRARGRPTEALVAARRSIELLESSSEGVEIASARAIAAWATIHLGDETGWEELNLALAEPNPAIRADVLLEAAETEALYGHALAASDYIAERLDLGARSSTESLAVFPVQSYVAIRHKRHAEAEAFLARIDIDHPTGRVGHKSFALCVRAHALLAAGSSEANDAISSARSHALAQAADRWVGYCDALLAASNGPDALGQHLRSSGRSESWQLSYVADLIVGCLDQVDQAAHDVVVAEAQRRPRRWRQPLRQVVDNSEPSSIRAARILDEIGEAEDVARLRRFAQRFRGRPDRELGRTLARRIADRVEVEDQGRVSIRIGDRVVDGSAVRRKVLALLCFLLSRPRFAATRDEVMDALWPEFDPTDALNSLNQTVYFLRRVFEPDYKDDLSPGYVHHESDVIWLDSRLVRSRSQRCLAIIQAMPINPAPSDVAELSTAYFGPFALDFAYEDWASDFRSSLHAAYLQIIEKAVAADTASGHFERGIGLARRALDLAPEADQIELSLLRLLRLHGSFSAAAEQYAHYAAAQRDTFGIEPPALESL